MIEDTSWTSLRVRKQHRQRAEIIENGVALFRESSFEAVPVRTIAARCEISEATFFNYFPSKDAMLAEWAEAVVESCFDAVVSHSERPLRRQVRDAIHALAAQVEEDPELMRAAWSRARVALPETGRGGARLRGRTASPTAGAVCRLLEHARGRGEVRSDVPQTELAELLLAGLQSALARWLADPESAEAGVRLEARLTRATDVLLDGFRKRNERVRAALSGSSVAPR